MAVTTTLSSRAGGRDYRGYVAALDQGTTSTRCIIVDRAGQMVGAASRPLPLSYPHPGWVEHDAQLIITHVREVITEALANARLSPRHLAALGITN